MLTENVKKTLITCSSVHTETVWSVGMTFRSGHDVGTAFILVRFVRSERKVQVRVNGVFPYTYPFMTCKCRMATSTVLRTAWAGSWNISRMLEVGTGRSVYGSGKMSAHFRNWKLCLYEISVTWSRKFAFRNAVLCLYIGGCMKGNTLEMRMFWKEQWRFLEFYAFFVDTKQRFFSLIKFCFCRLCSG